MGIARLDKNIDPPSLYCAAKLSSGRVYKFAARRFRKSYRALTQRRWRCTAARSSINTGANRLQTSSLLPFAGKIVRVETGAWAGWYAWGGTDPFENAVGPFFVRRDEQGIVTGFLPGPNNLNGDGMVHGGCLMTFADFSMFMFAAADGHDVGGVTVSMNSDFIGAAQGGILLESRGELLGGGRSLAFVRGIITSGEARVLSYSGTIKRAKPATSQ